MHESSGALPARSLRRLRLFLKGLPVLLLDWMKRLVST